MNRSTSRCGLSLYMEGERSLPDHARRVDSAPRHGIIVGLVKVAIVISQFPCNDEVFILRELRALARRGLDLRIFSLKPAPEKSLHADAKPLLGAAQYSPFLWSREV